MEFSDRKSIGDLAADWRRWTRAERILAIALGATLTIILAAIAHFTI